MTTTLFENEYVSLILDEPQGLVSFIRSARPLPSAGEAHRTFEALSDVAATLPRDKYLLLTDMRAVVGRNDPDFEKVVQVLRTRLLSRFRKRAALIRTLTGKLQISRLEREHGAAHVETFDDEEAALRYLLEP